MSDLDALPDFKTLADESIKHLEIVALPKGFEKRKDGIFYEVEKGDDAEWKWLCSPIEVKAVTRGADSRDWGRLIEITDPDGRKHSWALPATLFAGDTSALLSECYRLGLRMTTADRAASRLKSLLQMWTPPARAICSARLGWTDETCATFILGDGRTLGGGHVVYQSEHVPGAASAIHSRGSLDQWRENVADLASGNPLMIAVTSLAFAGALLDPLGIEGGGLHLRGQSSRGKTSLLAVAASVWGSPQFIQSWRATANGLEGIASVCNGTLIALDEMGEISGKEAGAAAYMLANGQGKARADRNGNARQAARWRTVILSSGELSLADKMSEAGQRIRAGQEVRILDVKADGQTYGAFDDLHGSPSPAAFSDTVRKNAAAHYGTAGPVFVDHLLGDMDTFRDQVRASIDGFKDIATGDLDGAQDGQIVRALDRFGLIAAAGELATAFGLTGWSRGAALDASMIAFRTWADGRGGSGSAEAREAVSRVRAFIAAHGPSRFESLGIEDSRTVLNRAGWRDGDTYYIHLDAWKEIHAGSDAKQAAVYLRDAGFLIHEPDRLTHKTPRGVQDRVRAYAIKGEIMGASHD